jgi:four helix bundle protein
VISYQEKKMAGDVEDLLVYRRAYALSLALHRASLGWPSVEQHGGIASQLRRSSKSVCALLAEGAGRLRRSRVEFERYLVMALGSADETRLWCRYAEDLGYTTAEQGVAWRDSYAEIARMLQGLLARQKRRLSPDP